MNMLPSTDKKIGKIILPSLRGRAGDSYYYVALMTFEEIKKRVLIISDDFFDKDANSVKGVSLKESKVKDLVSYLQNQKQRFFGSLILGIDGGKSTWQDIDIRDKNIEEDRLNYLSSSMGILNLDGNERIFVIDGQHRVLAIKKALEENPSLADDEVSVIFITPSPNSSTT